jgi:hypothetical protein
MKRAGGSLGYGGTGRAGVMSIRDWFVLSVYSWMDTHQSPVDTMETSRMNFSCYEAA